MNNAAAIMGYYDGLIPPVIPTEFQKLLPFKQAAVRDLMHQFYLTYYADSNPRIGLFGINPGRLGSGQTGIGFTDPFQLTTSCGIHHQLPMDKELSSTFIYEVIHAFGGVQAFYEHFYITAVSPIGFLREGKNANFYDQKSLLSATEEWIIQELKRQTALPFLAKTVVCIGQGKNHDLLSKWNGLHHLFREIIVLPHPRWIMQYKRKKLEQFIDQYVQTLKKTQYKKGRLRLRGNPPPFGSPYK